MRERAMGSEFTIRKSDRVRVYHEKKSDRVRVDHEKKRAGMRLYHRKEGWSESSP